MFRSYGLIIVVLALAVVCREAQTAETNLKFYGLGDLGRESSLGDWLLKNLPELIAPGTWNGQGGAKITYCEPANALVVQHTPEVQAKVAAFLHNLKKASQTRAKAKIPILPNANSSPVMPAQFATPAVPAPSPKLETSKAPKHLFHFIIDGLEGTNGDNGEYKLKNFTLRYEGEGIVDDNIIKLIKWAGKTGTTYEPSPGILPFGLYLKKEPTYSGPNSQSPPPTKAIENPVCSPPPGGAPLGPNGQYGHLPLMPPADRSPIPKVDPLPPLDPQPAPVAPPQKLPKQIEAIRANNRLFNIPVVIDENVRKTLDKVCLYVKAGQGDWICQEIGTPTIANFTYRAPKDGEYLFNVVTIDKTGRAAPANVATMEPALRVLVDMAKPKQPPASRR